MGVETESRVEEAVKPEIFSFSPKTEAYLLRLGLKIFRPTTRLEFPSSSFQTRWHEQPAFSGFDFRKDPPLFCELAFYPFPSGFSLQGSNGLTLHEQLDMLEKEKIEVPESIRVLFGITDFVNMLQVVNRNKIGLLDKGTTIRTATSYKKGYHLGINDSKDSGLGIVIAGDNLIADALYMPFALAPKSAEMLVKQRMSSLKEA